ncbi:MAG: heme exporter protein CcmD [Xanthomonadales bacterium]|jgi:heme exporter protein CcmD|nr:heme exporter protein CcmD [Xanthomonadales bacterium]
MNAGFNPDHAPFIFAAYGISMVVLLWTAIGPLLKERKLKRMLKAALRREEQKAS